MRAVNLIPPDRRRGSSPLGRSGGGVYLALGFLALLVVMAGAYVLSSWSLDEKRAQIAQTEQRAQVAEAKAGSLRPYTEFTALRQKRVSTVQSLAASRFDWSHALHELARALPRYAWLTSLRATVTPDAQVDGGQTDPLRKSLAVPAVEVVGCTTSQDNVARVMSALRRIDGVQRVGLSSSRKSDVTGGAPGSSSSAGGGTSTSADCRAGSARYSQFSMTVFFTAPAAATTPAPGATTSPASTGSTK
jgi:Tfp pilus assembly protein PilN